MNDSSDQCRVGDNEISPASRVNLLLFQTGTMVVSTLLQNGQRLPAGNPDVNQFLDRMLVLTLRRAQPLTVSKFNMNEKILVIRLEIFCAILRWVIFYHDRTSLRIVDDCKTKQTKDVR